MTTSTSDTGKGTVGFDAKVGLFTNAIVTAVGLAVVDALGKLDFSGAGNVVATLAPPAVGLLVGFITTKVLPRFSGSAARR